MKNKKIPNQQPQQQDDDQYQKQERQIQKLIETYKDKRKQKILKQINYAFYNYEQLIETNYASPAKWAWLAEKKSGVQTLKNQKLTQNQDQNGRNFVTKDHIKVLRQKNDQRFQGMNTDLEAGIQISKHIAIQLDKQIQNLDRIYEINKDIDTKIKRSIDGLRTMLRRIFLSKITRCMSILTVLAVIVLIVVYVLKSNGIIK